MFQKKTNWWMRLFDYLDSAVENLEEGMRSYDKLIRSVEWEKDAPMSGVRAKLAAAEQAYAGAIEDMSQSIAETKREQVIPHEEIEGYSPIFDENPLLIFQLRRYHFAFSYLNRRKL